MIFNIDDDDDTENSNKKFGAFANICYIISYFELKATFFASQEDAAGCPLIGFVYLLTYIACRRTILTLQLRNLRC